MSIPRSIKNDDGVGVSFNLSRILLILGLAGFTVMADNWVVSPILPAIAQNIGTPIVSTGLLITSYMIPFGLFQLVFGPLADRFGKRQILTFAILFFTFIGFIMTAFGITAVIAGRISGKLAAKLGRKKVFAIGLLSATVADLLIFLGGNILVLLIVDVALLGLGFMLAHSTFLTIATEFAAKARGAAMSLVAFFFMGAGGLGTAIGGQFIKLWGYPQFFLTYGAGLFLLLLISVLIVKTETGAIVDKH